jgi:hypothetical protein
MKNINIKEWYLNTYPTDDLGCEINNDATFNDLLTCLSDCKDIYELLGVSDSLVRERAFCKLSDLMSVDYSYIYKQWLKY